MNLSEQDKEAFYRAYLFYKTMIDFLDAFCENDWLGLHSNDSRLYSNELYLRLCDKLVPYLKEPSFPNRRKWRPYRNLASLNLEHEGNWEVNLKPQCFKILGAIQKDIITKGIKEYPLSADDEALLNDIQESIGSMAAIRNNYLRESPETNGSSIIEKQMDSTQSGGNENTQVVLRPSDSYAKDERIFQCQGATWFVVYDGIGKSVGHSLGMTYICYLLQNPGQEIHAVSLRANLHQKLSCSVVEDEVIDNKTIKDCKERLEEINMHLDEEDPRVDLDLKEQLKDERKKLKSEISRGTDRSGKPRKVSTDRERARQSVSKAISTALKAIQKVNEPLWLHLYHSIRTGEYLSYRPDQSTSWTTK